MTKGEFWGFLADYIDCGDCVFYDDCNRVAEMHANGRSDCRCAEELRRIYEALSEGEDNGRE